MRADRFEDLIALVALYRPGPMANIPTYCARKHGQEAPEYLDPQLEPILRETFGIIVYQEQVMQVAQTLAGYSLGDADLLRRAMGKKIKAEMDAQRERFVSGSVERGLPKAKANEIFDLLAKFADYGFNKSHAAAYALVAYQTAYLKANFPVEFGGVDDARHGQYRQARGFPARGAASRHCGRASLRQPFRHRLRCRERRHPLRARGGQGRRRAGGRVDRGRAR